MTKMIFETFSDINHMPLRVYNRVVYMTNLLTGFGREASADYIKLFDESERKQMYVMQAYITQKGVDEARKAVTKGLEVAYDPA